MQKISSRLFWLIQPVNAFGRRGPEVQILSLRPAFSRTLRPSPEQPKRAAAHANTAPAVLIAGGIVGAAPDLVAPAVQNNLQVEGCRAIRHRRSPNELYRGFDIGDVQV